jgi:hypothetical protein
MNAGRSDGGHSRFTFFDVCIFVTASEGEELIVDVIGRHGERSRRWKREYFRGIRWVRGADMVSRDRS